MKSEQSDITTKTEYTKNEDACGCLAGRDTEFLAHQCQRRYLRAGKDAYAHAEVLKTVRHRDFTLSADAF